MLYSVYNLLMFICLLLRMIIESSWNIHKLYMECCILSTEKLRFSINNNLSLKLIPFLLGCHDGIDWISLFNVVDQPWLLQFVCVPSSSSRQHCSEPDLDSSSHCPHLFRPRYSISSLSSHISCGWILQWFLYTSWCHALGVSCINQCLFPVLLWWLWGFISE